MLGKNELKRLHPFLNTDDLEGGVWVPEDAIANPQAICKSLAKLASEGGAQYITNCHIQKVVTEEDRIKGIDTSRGFIHCEYFVNCAGMVINYFLKLKKLKYWEIIFLNILSKTQNYNDENNNFNYHLNHNFVKIIIIVFYVLNWRENLFFMKINTL